MMPKLTFQTIYYLVMDINEFLDTSLHTTLELLLGL